MCIVDTNDISSNDENLEPDGLPDKELDRIRQDEYTSRSNILARLQRGTTVRVKRIWQKIWGASLLRKVIGSVIVSLIASLIASLIVSLINPAIMMAFACFFFGDCDMDDPQGVFLEITNREEVGGMVKTDCQSDGCHGEPGWMTTVTAIPNDGFGFVNWICTPECPEGFDPNQNPLFNFQVNENIELRARFTEVTEAFLYLRNVEGGRTRVACFYTELERNVTIGEYEYLRCRRSIGGTVLIMPITFPGYTFELWECPLGCPDNFDIRSDNTQEVRLTRDFILLPVYKEVPVPVQIGIDYDSLSRKLGSGRIKIYENGNLVFNEKCENDNDGSNDNCDDYSPDNWFVNLSVGSTVRIVATGSSCFQFDQWSHSNLPGIEDGWNSPDYTFTFNPTNNNNVEIDATFDAIGPIILEQPWQMFPDTDCRDEN